MKPMLATSRQANQPNNPERYVGWIADHKLDGLRAMVAWSGSEIVITGRNEVDITRQFPDVEAFLTRALKGYASATLDGEIIALDGVFNTVATRGKQVQPVAIVLGAQKQPCKFVCFDLLHLAEVDFMSKPFYHRRAAMTQLCQNTGIEPVVSSTDPVLLSRLTKQAGLEGIIVKNPMGLYRFGTRAKDWVKIKNTQSVTCVATGYHPGEGARKHFGAMDIALIDTVAGTIVPVGRVGTGFTAKDIVWLKSVLDAGQPIVVEIECLNRTGTDQLRFPVYLGPRTDLSVSDATVDQLQNLAVC